MSELFMPSVQARTMLNSKQQGYISTVRMEVVVAANRPKPVWLLHLPHAPCLYMFNLHMCTLFFFLPSVVSPEAKSLNLWKIQPPFFTWYFSVYDHVEPVGKSASLCSDTPKRTISVRFWPRKGDLSPLNKDVFAQFVQNMTDSFLWFYFFQYILTKRDKKHSNDFSYTVLY